MGQGKRAPAEPNPFRKIARKVPAAEEQAVLWAAFAFAVGILTYLELPEEPEALVVGPVFLAALLAVALRYVRGRHRLVEVLLLAVLAGVLAGSLRVHSVDAPRLTGERTLGLEGQVLDRQQTERGPRLVLKVLAYEDRGRKVPPGYRDTGDPLPVKVRISVPEETQARIGDWVKLKARLFPPAGPVRPGGYDFSFWAFFDGIGATGFSYGLPQGLDTDGPSPRDQWSSPPAGLPAGLAVKRGLEDIRGRLASRIRGLLQPGDSAELAVALLVGDRSGLSEDGVETLRAAGLAHVLAISGLHMALFAGGAFAAVLVVLAGFETIALRLPSHKVAAFTALLAATVYLALSGASVATQRSYIMIALVFLGLVVSRKGLTLHSVALAALLLLLMAPERLMHPGFQMSFAAVICLVAVYDSWRRVKMGRERVLSDGPKSLGWRVLGTVGLWICGLAVTALVAGTATGIIGAHHFGRIAPMGLVGNILGMPVFTLLVMPMGAIALVLVPFGLAVLPLTVMDAALRLLLAIAQWTAGLGLANERIVPPGAAPTLMLMTGLFVLLLARGWWRSGALPCAVAAGLLFWTGRPPDVQISAAGQGLAARQADGQLRINATRAGFETDLWLQAEGLAPEAFSGHRMSPGQRLCDDTGCVVQAYAPLRSEGPALASGRGRPASAEPLKIALPRTVEALLLDCSLADVIVTDFLVPDTCKAEVVFDAAARRESGAVSIWLTEQDAEDRSSRVGTGRRTVVSRWRASKTRPPRLWHRPVTAPD